MWIVRFKVCLIYTFHDLSSKFIQFCITWNNRYLVRMRLITEILWQLPFWGKKKICELARKKSVKCCVVIHIGKFCLDISIGKFRNWRKITLFVSLTWKWGAHTRANWQLGMIYMGNLLCVQRFSQNCDHLPFVQSAFDCITVDFRHISNLSAVNCPSALHNRNAQTNAHEMQ